MKTLIVEDDFTSRVLLQELLKRYGASHVAVNGREAVEAVRCALQADAPYDLICLDIMMPVMDGLEALKQIRALEMEHGLTSRGTKIVMTTALGDIPSVATAFSGLCDSYLTKPISKDKLQAELRQLDFIQ